MLTDKPSQALAYEPKERLTNKKKKSQALALSRKRLTSKQPGADTKSRLIIIKQPKQRLSLLTNRPDA